MAICLSVIGILAAENMNTLLVVIMMVFLAVYQLTLGTYCWVYLGAVACDEGLSIGTGVIWFGVLILTVSTNTMFDKMGSAGVFFFFAAGSFASAVFFFFFLKETKGLSREETQALYSNHQRNSTAGSDDTRNLLANKKNSIGGTITESQILDSP